MSYKQDKPVPIFQYTPNSYGGYIPLNQIPSNTQHVWAPNKGGGPVTTPGPVTYSTVMPNGQTAHLGVYTNYGGNPVITYHHPGQLPSNPHGHIHNVMNTRLSYRPF